MEIMAPVSSVEAANFYAKNGIKEVYVGVESLEKHNMKNVTFTGRSKRLDNGNSTQLKNFDELQEVVNICHKKDIKVNFTANIRNLPEALNKNYIEYVEKAIEVGVDTLIVGSIGSLILLNQKNYNIPIHSSTFFYPFNKKNVDFFHDLNVKRIIMPTALTLDEIKEVKDYIKSRNYNMEIEVFSHFGCSNINGRCNMFHNPPTLCRGRYEVYDSDSNLIKEDYNFLDAGKDCSICSLKKLMDCGVDSLKIMGRGLPLSLVGSLAVFYNNAIRKIVNGEDVREVRKDLLKKAPWWEISYCKDQRCLYRITDIAKFYI